MAEEKKDPKQTNVEEQLQKLTEQNKALSESLEEQKSALGNLTKERDDLAGRNTELSDELETLQVQNLSDEERTQKEIQKANTMAQEAIKIAKSKDVDIARLKVQQVYPDVPEEMIAGQTPEEIIASAKKGKSIIDAVKADAKKELAEKLSAAQEGNSADVLSGVGGQGQTQSSSVTDKDIEKMIDDPEITVDDMTETLLGRPLKSTS